MAVEKIVIEVSGQPQLQSTIDQLVKLGAVDAKNAEQFKKNNREFTEESKKAVAALERQKLVVDRLSDALHNAQKQYGINSAQAKGLNAALGVQTQKLHEATKAAGNLQTQLKKTGEQSQKTGSFIKNQFAAVGATIAGAFAVTQIVAFGKEAVNLAAKGEGIKRAFDALNQPDLLKNLQTATRNTVTDIDLMAAAVKANNFKIPLEDLARYFKFAQQRARETGESVDYLVESIVLGIGRKSPLILDNLGISAVELRAKLKGIGTETATIGQISSAVGIIIDEQLAKQGTQAETTADKIARIEVRWQNIKRGTGEALIAALDYFSGIDKGVEDVDALLKARLSRGFSAQLNQTIGEFEDAMANWSKSQQKAAEKPTDTVGVLLERIKALQEEYKDVSTPEQYAAITAKIKTVQEQLEKIIGKTTDKIKDQKKAIEDSGLAEYAANVRAGLEAGYKAEADALKQSAQDVADYESELRAEQRKEIKDQTNFEIAESERAAREKEQIAQDEADAQKLIQERLIQATSQLISMAVDYQLAAKQRETDYELNLLQEQYDAREISEEQYNSKRRAILRDQAQAQKEAAIIQATISTANAVIQAYSESAIAGPVLAAIAAAVGIAQIAAISATPIPQFEKGGKVKGKSHREGGVHAELEGDEFIISKKAARKIGFDNLEMLNKGILPPKLLKQGLMEQRNKSFETSMMKVFGSSDFDTYPIEKELRKSRKHDAELTHLLINKLSKGQQKRGNYA